MMLSIVHLYPDELGMFGDAGNVTALEKRAQWSGVDVEVTRVGLLDSIPHDADVYVIGSGSSAGVTAVGSVVPALSQALTDAHASGATIVAIGAGLHLLTTSIELASGTVVAGVGLIGARCVPRRKRLVGGVWAQRGDLGVAGYINSGHDLVGDVAPLLADFEGLDIERDGVSAPGIMGTHLHGPFLPMNPSFADEIIAQHTGVMVNADDPRVVRATRAAANSRLALRRELGL
jgi:CobQ-like glutamine amidotransferase family enzyme